MVSSCRCRRLAWLCALAAPAVIASFAACSSFSEDTPPATEAGTDGAPGSAAEAGADGAARDDAAPQDGGSTSAYRAAVLADEPLAYWRMGEKAGLLVHDETGRGNDLVLQGASGSYSLGVEGAIALDDDTAIRFDGRQGRARATDPRAFDFPNSAPFTVELWAKREAIDGGHTFQTLLSEMQGVNNNRTGYSVYVTPYPNDSGITVATSFEYNRYDAGDLSTLGTIIPTGKWAHYAAVFDAQKQITLYVNGTASVTRQVKGPLTLTTADLVIGASGGGGDDFPGVIDEVAIYPKALTITQIVAHLTAGSP